MASTWDGMSSVPSLLQLKFPPLHGSSLCQVDIELARHIHQAAALD